MREAAKIRGAAAAASGSADARTHAQGMMAAAGILSTYALATKIMEIGTAVQGLTAALALNPWALLITGVVASSSIIYKTWSDTQANLERGYEDLRRKALQ